MARSRDLEAHRQRLSAATWSVLAERGLTGLTVRAVAERAGCSTGLVLHTFGDKQALLSHARTLLHERTAIRADQAEATAEQPIDALRQVLLDAVSLTDEKREEARVWVGFLAAALSDPALAALHRKHNRAFLERLERLLDACRPNWNADQRARLAKSLCALVEGVNTLAAVDPDTYDVDTQRAAVENALATVRLPEPGAPKRPG